MFDVLEYEVSPDELEREVASYYGLSGLHSVILRNLAASGFDIERLMHDDLAPVDEFHMGGRAATDYLFGKMGLTGREHVLDVGCGLGGAARRLAAGFGCKVTGLDLTPENVAIARDLTARAGLDGLIAYKVGSALSAPFPAARFDAAINIDMAMNVHDRMRLYKEIARVLRPSAIFALYDAMMGWNEGLHFPVHWAERAEASHLTSPSQTGALLSAAGFLIEHIEERKESALAFLHERRAKLMGDAPLLGVHLRLGADARQKIENTIRNLEESRVVPVVMIARRAV
jgi:MPBQ/MSBQ methyltransferase